MRPRSGRPVDPGAHPARIARWASLVVAVALIALLGLARSTQAQNLPPASSHAMTPLAPSVEEWEEEAEEAEECEEGFGGEEAEEECEHEEAEFEGATGTEGAHEACLLRSATATVTALPARRRVRLVIRYTTFSPAVVALDYRLRGRRGALKLAADTKRFSRSGTYRRTDILSAAQMARAMAASEFVVHLHAVNTPLSCHRLFDRRLAVRRKLAGGGRVWSASRRSGRL